MSRRRLEKSRSRTGNEKPSSLFASGPSSSVHFCTRKFSLGVADSICPQEKPSKVPPEFSACGGKNITEPPCSANALSASAVVPLGRDFCQMIRLQSRQLS